MSKKFADIFDVARVAGVSTATVSRTLNNLKTVRPDTRKRVEQAILETGYIRNRAAQAVHGKKSGTIGFVVPTLDNAIFSKLIQAFSNELRESGFSMLVATHDYDLEREFDLIRTLLGHRVEGVALIGLNHRPETHEILQKRQVPVISLWSYEKETQQNCIGGDNFKAGKVLSQHLVQQGLKDFVTIFPDGTDNDRVSNRLDGVLSGLGQSSLNVAPQKRLTAPYSVAQARKTTEKYLTQNPLPEAFIAGNDVIALGVISAILCRGGRIPQDVSVVGFGDFTTSADIYPSITTVRMNPIKVGVLGAKKLIQLVQEPDSAQVKTEVPVELIVRESSI